MPPAPVLIGPACSRALDYVRKGDVLVVWKLDRLGRSLAHLIEVVTALEQRGVGFRSITEAIDTTTPGGRLVFHLFGALGQFERDLIRERTRAGLTAAAARGRKGGRKPVIDAEKLARARSMIAKGLTVRETATRLKIGKTALYDALRADATKGDTGGTKVDIGVGLGSQSDLMCCPLIRRPVNSRWAVCGRFAEQVEERRMWIEVEHLGRRQNRKSAVKIALAAVLAAGIAIGFLIPFHV